MTLTTDSYPLSVRNALKHPENSQTPIFRALNQDNAKKIFERGNMMSTELSQTPPTGGHYSHSLSAGGFVFVAGQTPRDRNRNVVGASIEEQTAATMENLRDVLQASGAILENVVKATVHLQNLGDAARFNAVYAKYFPTTKPVRTTVGSDLNGVLVEIDAIAYIGTTSPEKGLQA